MEIETLNAIISAHIRECDGRDVRNADAIKEVKEMFKGIWDAQNKMRKDVTALYIKGAMGLGGIMVIGKLLDYFMEWHSK